MKITTFKNYDESSFKIENNILKGCKKDFNDDRHIGQIVFDVLNKNPQHIGIVDAITGKKITFADMKEKSVRLALWLRKEGIVPGDMISLFSPIHRNVYSIIFATYFVGATYNPLDYDVNTLSARSYIRITQPKVIFAHEGKLNVIKEAAELESHECKMIVLGKRKGFESLDQILNQQTNDELKSFKVISELNPDLICAIDFSSGTTGTPKGIPLFYEQIKMQATTLILDEDVENDMHLCDCYPSWGIHLRYTLSFVIKNSTQIFHQIFDPNETCEVIEQYKISTVSLDTYKFMLLCTDDIEGKYNFESVQMIIPVGTKLSVRSMKIIQNRFPNALISKRMGLTETSELTRYTKECCNLLSEGIVGPNIQLAVKDFRTNENLSPNEVGELCVKTSAVISSYYKNPKETERAFDQEGWFHSGDEAYYDENGEVVIVGRMKDIIRYRDIDMQTSKNLALPDVAEAAVIGVPDEIAIERPIAFVKTKPGSKVTIDDISKVALQLEYSDILQNAIEFIAEMPRNTPGKIIKKVLKEIAKKYYE